MSAAKSRLEKTGERMAPRLFMRVATRNTYWQKNNIYLIFFIIIQKLKENLQN
jgi:hypothetical protein